MKNRAAFMFIKHTAQGLTQLSRVQQSAKLLERVGYLPGDAAEAMADRADTDMEDLVNQLRRDLTSR